ncbi:MAG: amidohydrolase family protein [Ectothiorhodospiraceae bacterium]|nr:amidohydrolase family protein [Ectothiorhodospiraceae bacterium]MCH8503170.1 amidohydrolase family protein [Ectothiorhodospiraceae bacterium]
MNARADIPGPVSSPRRPTNALPARSCDTHAHVFGPSDVYPFHPDRSYTPPDALKSTYIALLKQLGFERAVLVQPSVYGTDNRLLHDALESGQREDDGIEWRGIAVLDSEVDDSTLEQLHAVGVRGARINLLFRGGVNFDVADELARRIEPLGWHIQFLVDITTIPDFAKRLSTLPVPSVIDHMGHFPAPRGADEPALRELLAVMRENRTWVKLSGPNRISSHDFAPFHDAGQIARTFAETHPDKLVFGTDWPHVQIPTSMPDDGDLVDELFRWLDHDNTLLNRVLVANPARLYGF